LAPITSSSGVDVAPRVIEAGRVSLVDLVAVTGVS
jgi:hypothetical protein